MKYFAIVRLLSATALLAASVLAASPQLIDYQGFLKDNSGNSVTGSLNFTFKIYTASTGGTVKWQETQNSISVTGGLFSVTLGASTPIPDTVFNQTDRWLGITVGNGSELSPRTRISSSAYGQRVATVDGSSGGIISGDITAGKGNFGSSNVNYGKYAFVAGYSNSASGDSSSVAGGASNIASASGAFVGGGLSNTAGGDFSVVGGGGSNTASNGYSVVGGGKGNKARGAYSAVAGGGGASVQDSNVAVAPYSFVGGGRSNLNNGDFGVVAGGKSNRINAAGSGGDVIGGGNTNLISSSEGATIAGGAADTISGGTGSTIGGGYYNKITGIYAMIPGGQSNLAAGDYSFAAGRRAKTNNSGAFVWADGYDGEFSSSAANEFSVRASGGVRIYTNNSLTAGVTMASGASAWSSVSDSTLKRNIRLVNRKELLEKLMSLPIKQWSYKAQDASIEHIGPMAQDFYAVFQLGDDDKTISTIDLPGIALAAIQELDRRMDELDHKTAEIGRLSVQVEELRGLVRTLAERVGPSAIAPEKPLSALTENPIAGSR